MRFARQMNERTKGDKLLISCRSLGRSLLYSFFQLVLKRKKPGHQPWFLAL